MAKLHISVTLKLTLLHLDYFPFLWLLCSPLFCRHCRADLMVRRNTCWLFFLLKTQWNLNSFTSSMAVLLPLQYSNVTTSCVSQTIRKHWGSVLFICCVRKNQHDIQDVCHAFNFCVYKLHILFQAVLGILQSSSKWYTLYYIGA